MNQFSAVIITLNEAENIIACLDALKKVSDDILVIDAKSEDETVTICKERGVRVFEKDWVNYSENKNFGNSLSKNDWIISIDADEVLSAELIETIQNLKPKNGKVYALDRISSYCGKWIQYGAWYPDWKVRIFNRKDVQWKGYFVHETLDIPSDFEIIRLKGKLWHFSYKSEEDFEKRLSTYSKLASEELFRKGKKANFLKLWFSPIIRFMRDYFLKKGFLDGKEGFVIARGNASVVYRKYQLVRERNRAIES